MIIKKRKKPNELVQLTANQRRFACGLSANAATWSLDGDIEALIKKGAIFELMEAALKVKFKERGTAFSLCSIMNVKSGACTEDCAYCAQSARHKTNAPIYPMRSCDEIALHAEHAKAIGAERFSLVASGRGPDDKEVYEAAEAIRFVKKRVDIKICASLGLIGYNHLLILKDAGLTRYHHNLETSGNFFSSVCSTHSFHDRVETLLNIKKAGLECCSGGILGLGEGRDDRLDLAMTLMDIGVDSVPINILLPIEGTRIWKSAPYISPIEVIETIAIFRLILKTPSIRLAGGREKGLNDFLAMAFLAGADGLMIGGYLTAKGRNPVMDIKLKENILKAWDRARCE